MEIFKQTNYDFLGKKWPFIVASLVLTVAGFISLGIKGGPRYGIDFRGGALMDVKFSSPPPDGKIRSRSRRTSGRHHRTERRRRLERSPDRHRAEERPGAGRGPCRHDPDPRGDLHPPSRRRACWISTTPAPQALVDRLRDPLVRNGVALSDQQLQDLVGRMRRLSRPRPVRSC